MENERGVILSLHYRKAALSLWMWKKWAKTSAKADNVREERINADLMSQQRGTKKRQGPKAALHQTLLFKHLTQQWRGEAGDDDDLRFNDSITVLGD